MIGTDPADPVVQQPARTPLPVILGDPEIDQLISTAQAYLADEAKPDARPYLLINLLLETGMKKAECARLLISDVDLSGADAVEITVRYPDERLPTKMAP